MGELLRRVLPELRLQKGVLHLSLQNGAGA
jgi:hypothetical protein